MPEKCNFGYEKLKFLGHIVSSRGVCPDREKATTVALFLMPKMKRNVHLFLSLCAYYCCFVPNFSQIAEPLQQLIKDDVAFTCGSAQSEAFRELQQHLQNPPILGHFDQKQIRKGTLMLATLISELCSCSFKKASNALLSMLGTRRLLLRRTIQQLKRNAWSSCGLLQRFGHTCTNGPSVSSAITTLSAGWRISKILRVVL